MKISNLVLIIDIIIDIASNEEVLNFKYNFIDKLNQYNHIYH